MPYLERLDEDADVLVVGGGLAGCMAAIRARELGASVLMAEKADTLRSGCAGMGVDRCWTYIPDIHRDQITAEDMISDHTPHASRRCPITGVLSSGRYRSGRWACAAPFHGLGQ